MGDGDKASPDVAAQSPAKLAKTKKSKKPLIITLIIAGALLLAGVGFAIWYFAYYNSDRKVLSDAFYNLTSTTEGTTEAKMTIKIVGDDVGTPDMSLSANIKAKYNKDAIAMDIDGKLSAETMSVGASANLVANMKDGEFYVKVNDLEGVLNSVGMSSAALGVDLSAVSDKWIKISSDDLGDLIPQADVSTDDFSKCLEKAGTTLREQRSVQKELLDAIQDSKALTAKRVGKDRDGIKFQLTGDIKATPELASKLKSTEIFKSLSDCAKKLDDADTAADIARVAEDDFDLATIEEALGQLSIEVNFWVSPWGHQATRLLVSVKVDEPKVEFTLDMTNKSGKTEIKMPSDSTSLTSIIEDLMGSYSPYSDLIDYDDVYDYL
ncbi:hypothetical protein FWD20_00040 [Candidatus Saccharibacteria bacterium]|nr:hypothetical protein [Candidatus Saccharibacteria bacterium]